VVQGHRLGVSRAVGESFYRTPGGGPDARAEEELDGGVPRSALHVAINREIIAHCSARDIIALVGRRMSELDRVNFVTAFHRIAKLPDASSIRMLPTVQHLGRLLLSEMGDFGPYNLTNTVSAFARLSVHDQPGIDAISSAAITKISEFKPRRLSHTAWSFSRMAVVNLPLRTAISAAAIPKISEFDGQDLSITAWAWAGLWF